MELHPPPPVLPSLGFSERRNLKKCFNFLQCKPTLSMWSSSFLRQGLARFTCYTAKKVATVILCCQEFCRTISPETSREIDRQCACVDPSQHVGSWDGTEMKSMCWEKGGDLQESRPDWVLKKGSQALRNKALLTSMSRRSIPHIPGLQCNPQ